MKEHNQNEEASKLFFSNVILTSKIKKLTETNRELKEKIEKLELAKLNKPAVVEKKKRKRRTKTEIVRTFQCSIENCQKSYGLVKKHRKLFESTYEVET